MIRYYVIWTAIPGSEMAPTAKPESREYTTLSGAQRRCEAVFNGWQPQLIEVHALTEEDIEKVRLEIVAAGRW